MTTTTTTTEEPRTNYPYLTGALKSAMKFLSNDLVASGLITKDQMESVNEMTARIYEDAERSAIAFEKIRLERKEAFMQKQCQKKLF